MREQFGDQTYLNWLFIAARAHLDVAK